MISRPLVITLLLLATACSSVDKTRRKIVGPTLADIPDKTAELTQTSTLDEDVSLEKVEEYYQRALNAATDAGTRRTILIRLADILMLRSEDEMLSSNQSGRYFGEAIERYRELIELQKQTKVEGGDADKHNKEIDQMLYQLSKAYALDGKVEAADESLKALTAGYQDSSYSPEAKFRRAEQAFSNGNYAEAQQLYQEVIEQGTFTPFYQNAIYMYGWAQFKRLEYEGAILAFIKVLDHLYGATAPLRTVPDSQQNLADDTLRVMSLSFSYLEGAKTLSESFADKTQRPYLYKLYQALGELYFEKKRYRDSADAYRQYVLDNPLSDKAPLFSGYIIDVYDKGNFPSLLIPAKEDYVVNYGIDSQYWKTKPESVRVALAVNLKIYLEELAKYEHATAQKLVRDQAQKVQNKNSVVVSSDPKPAFLKAAAWYDQYARTFPNDTKTPDMLFLMAEALSEAGELSRAFDAYTRLAYDFPLPPAKRERGAEAGYAAIVLAQKLIAQVQVEGELQQWNEQLIDQSLRFADKYDTDPRAAGVLSAGAEKLVQAGRQPEAILAAKRVTQWQPQADAQLRRSAWLVIGQSEFDLANYLGSDDAYAQALLLIPVNDPSRSSIVERQAASIYKFAEILSAQGQTQTAVNQLLRIQQIAPDTAIAITAQYDAGNQLMTLNRWQQAEGVFLNFRRRYPNHGLTKTLYAKLVVIYQETEQWLLAGNELREMASVSDDPVLRRQSLLLAAELYEKSGQTAQAFDSYQQYIQRYPQPLDDRVEAINKLARLYKNQNNTQQYEYWLEQLIVAHDSAGTEKTDRSLYLAASAVNYQAQKEYRRFAAVRLTLPLKNSLKEKQAALGSTVAAYQKVIDYGVADFVTEANYYVAQVYVELSGDLLQSERPKGLDALALEQYEVLLEEQIFPIEEKAIALHQANISRAKDNLYDDWVKSSYSALAKLSPGQYNKPESRGVLRELY
jgi:TolA-binding protein